MEIGSLTLTGHFRPLPTLLYCSEMEQECVDGGEACLGCRWFFYKNLESLVINCLRVKLITCSRSLENMTVQLRAFSRRAQ